MDPVVGAAAISAGGNLLGNLFGGSQNYKNSKKLMAYQNEMNIANWKMQNQYNSPGAAMARLREAGLNPSLFYSSGQQGANSASPIPTVSPVSPGTMDLSHIGTDAANIYLNAKMQSQQIENLKSQNDATIAEAKLKALEVAKELFKQPYFERAAKYWIDNLFLQNSSLDTTIKQGEANVSLTMAQVGSYAEELQAKLKNMDAQTQYYYMRRQVEKTASEMNIKLTDAQISHYAALCRNIGLSSDAQDMANKMMEWENEQKKLGTIEHREGESFLEGVFKNAVNSWSNGRGPSFNYGNFSRSETNYRWDSQYRYGTTNTTINK